MRLRIVYAALLSLCMALLAGAPLQGQEKKKIPFMPASKPSPP